MGQFKITMRHADLKTRSDVLNDDETEPLQLKEFCQKQTRITTIKFKLFST